MNTHDETDEEIETVPDEAHLARVEKNKAQWRFEENAPEGWNTIGTQWQKMYEDRWLRATALLLRPKSRWAICWLYLVRIWRILWE